MRLKKLEIERNWKYKPEEPDTYKGTIVFDSEAGSVALVLTEQQVERMFEVVADAIVATAKDAAENLTAQAIDHKRALLGGPR